MGASEVLTIDPGSSVVPADACPKCGETWGTLPPVEAAGLGGVLIRRCSRCGIRATSGRTPLEFLVTCETCRLPFLREDNGSAGPRQCAGCVEALSSEPPEPHVVHAMETEIRSALHEAWRFVAKDTLTRYLEGILQQLTVRTEGSPGGCRVVLVDEPVLRILTLPSGLILMSMGMLRFLDDEAELVFVLARELAHVTSGEAAARVVRASLGAIARDDAGRPDTAWTEAMVDLARLGYGRRSELDADAAALRKMIALRYDPTSSLNLMGRLKLAIETGSRDARDVAVAYPPPGYRARKLERILYGRIGRAPVQRVNREVFRRVAGRDAVRSGLAAAALGTLDAPAPATDNTAEAGPSPTRWVLLVVLLAVLLVALGLILGT